MFTAKLYATFVLLPVQKAQTPQLICYYSHEPILELCRYVLTFHVFLSGNSLIPSLINGEY